MRRQLVRRGPPQGESFATVVPNPTTESKAVGAWRVWVGQKAEVTDAHEAFGKLVVPPITVVSREPESRPPGFDLDVRRDFC